MQDSGDYACLAEIWPVSLSSNIARFIVYGEYKEHQSRFTPVAHSIQRQHLFTHDKITAELMWSCIYKIKRVLFTNKHP